MREYKDNPTFDDETNAMLREWYNRQDDRCTCRPMIRNGLDVVVPTQNANGCELHCMHYGVIGGKYYCGKEM